MAALDYILKNDEDVTFVTQKNLAHLTREEVDRYISLMNQLENYPYSLNYFENFHAENLMILKKYGVKRGFLASAKHLYYNVDEETGIGIFIRYKRWLTYDTLTVVRIDAKGYNALDFFLKREIGHITHQKIEASDFASSLSRGIWHDISFKDFFKLEPSMLRMHKSSETKPITHYYKY